jgi:hypothetical protein
MTSKKHDFKYPLDKRPVRFSPNAAEAATKTFGDVQYTIGNPPKPPEIANNKVEVGLA